MLRDTNASAALAASIFHFGEYTVSDVKEYLKKGGGACPAVVVSGNDVSAVDRAGLMRDRKYS